MLWIYQSLFWCFRKLLNFNHLFLCLFLLSRSFFSNSVGCFSKIMKKIRFPGAKGKTRNETKRRKFQWNRRNNEGNEDDISWSNDEDYEDDISWQLRLCQVQHLFYSANCTCPGLLCDKKRRHSQDLLFEHSRLRFQFNRILKIPVSTD